ncbi:MAG: chaperone modulator CbpM [Flavisolibacter sp.]|nr:chaperone modulator CbpM [Flavisolibacter sp.]MBD0368630.1 chaperone modulator CbpM [Flavisolibacter sp.]
MDTHELIPAEECCIHYQIQYSFVQSLHQSSLIDLIEMEEKVFIPSSQLHSLEKYIRLHYDLDINMEGLETIAHLLNCIEELQQENLSLKNRLRLFEP